MDQNELAIKLSKEAGVTKLEAELVITALRNTIREVVKNGGEVKIHKLGTFTSYTRKKRNVRDPRTFKEFVTPKRIMPKVIIHQSFKDLLK